MNSIFINRANKQTKVYVFSFILKAWLIVAWKEYCVEYWLKELQESRDRYTGRRDITEILLKKALSTIQLIYQSMVDKTGADIKDQTAHSSL